MQELMNVPSWTADLIGFSVNWHYSSSDLVTPFESLLKGRTRWFHCRIMNEYVLYVIMSSLSSTVQYRVVLPAFFGYAKEISTVNVCNIEFALDQQLHSFHKSLTVLFPFHGDYPSLKSKRARFRRKRRSESNCCRRLWSAASVDSSQLQRLAPRR